MNEDGIILPTYFLIYFLVNTYLIYFEKKYDQEHVLKKFKN